MANNSQPMVAWVQISKKDVARAEQALLQDEKGVVDEIGLLSLHQAISDHLFPGTSVLHTRLRYALFVPWLMELAVELRPTNPRAALKELECKLTGRLKVGTEKSDEGQRKELGIEKLDDGERIGVIGRIKHPEATAQPPSFSYWTALSTWGILHRQYRGASREHVLAKVAEYRSSTRGPKDEDGKSLSTDSAPFMGIPLPPSEFLEKPLNFRLRTEEADFLRKRLVAVNRPSDGRTSLLAQMAERRIIPTGEFPWTDEKVVKAADGHDKEFLLMASRCSSLACVARSAYFALTEAASEKQGFSDSHIHREHLEAMRAQHGHNALALNLLDLKSPEVGLNVKDELVVLLEQTQQWLRKSSSVVSLQECYAHAEEALKGSRARLGAKDLGRSRLYTWATTDLGNLAEPLHFRWDKVRRMITDLNVPVTTGGR